METVNEKIFNNVIQHQVSVLRYSSGLSNRVGNLIRETEEELERLILFYATQLANRPLVEKGTPRKLRTMEREITQLRDTAWREVRGLIISELAEFSTIETTAISGIIKENIPVRADIKTPTKAAILERVESVRFEGRNLDEWVEHSRNSDIAKINQRFTQSVSRGFDAKNIVTNVMGSRTVAGVARSAIMGSEAVIYTATNNIQNQATSAVIEENEWLAEREYLVATLDGNTTPICQSLDGNIYEYARGPYPPFHIRCRTLRLPHITHENMGTRPFKATTNDLLLREYKRDNSIRGPRTRADLPRGHKVGFDRYRRTRTRELVGEVPDKTTYSDWLRTQSHEFQAVALRSAKRAEVFRREGLDIKHLVNRNGDYISLDELARSGRL